MKAKVLVTTSVGEFSLETSVEADEIPFNRLQQAVDSMFTSAQLVHNEREKKERKQL